MKKATLISIVGLFLGLSSTAVAQQEDFCQSDDYDRSRGECSPGTQNVGFEAQNSAIQALLNGGGSATALRRISEYNEMVMNPEAVRLGIELINTHSDREVVDTMAWSLTRNWLQRPMLRRVFVTQLQSPDADLRARALQVLGRLRSNDTINVIANLASNDTEAQVRAEAVRALGQLNHRDGVAPIAERLQDADPTVVGAALDAIRENRFYDRHVDVVAVLASDSAENRREAALLLGRNRVGMASEALGMLLRGDAVASVRQAAAWALGRIGNEVARTALNEVQVTESVRNVRQAIDVALQMRAR
ncbi:MAG: HEAT repeat domain-containing protein [Myxococcota bacterium]